MLKTFNNQEIKFIIFIILIYISFKLHYEDERKTICKNLDKNVALQHFLLGHHTFNIFCLIGWYLLPKCYLSLFLFIMFFLKLHWVLCGDVCVLNDMYYNSCGVINMKDNNYESYLFKDIFWYIGIKSLKFRILIYECITTLGVLYALNYYKIIKFKYLNF